MAEGATPVIICFIVTLWAGFAIPVAEWSEQLHTTSRRSAPSGAHRVVVSCGRARVSRQKSCNVWIGWIVPTGNAILDAATSVANDWVWLAVAWHAGLGALLVALVLGWRPPARSLACLLVAPIVSVSAVAWASGNPFTGTVFAAFALIFGRAILRLPRRAVELSSGPAIILGALFTTFGWIYPHFLRTTAWPEYLYAAPLGLLPCPTLTALIGVTLICGFSRCAPWTITMATAAALYGLIGVFALGVGLDYALLAGAGVLVAGLALASRPTNRSIALMPSIR